MLQRSLCLLGATLICCFAPTAARASAPEECHALAGTPDPTALQVQAEVSEGKLGEAIEAFLGIQNGMVWYCNAKDQFDVGAAPGPETPQAAQAEIEAIIVERLSASEAAWLDPHVRVLSVPASLAQLKQLQTEIGARLLQEPDPCHWWSAGLGLVSSHPGITISLYKYATAADEDAARQIVNEHGGLVVMEHSRFGTPRIAPYVGNSPAPVIGELCYRRSRDRLVVELAARSAPLHHVVLVAMSPSGRQLARKRLAHLPTRPAVTISLRLTSVPTEVILVVRGRTGDGTRVEVDRRT